MKNYVKNLLVFALFVLALSGLMIHLRVHPIAKNVYGYVPLIAGLISAIAIPILFMFRKTLHLAYILNGFTAIIGIITMTHFSIVKAPLIADILFLVAKFIVGRVIFCIEVFPLEGEAKNPGLRWIRYPNTGFWAVHLVLLSVVYYLGNLLWR
jgi:hypothetical protein